MENMSTSDRLHLLPSCYQRMVGTKVYLVTSDMCNVDTRPCSTSKLSVRTAHQGQPRLNAQQPYSYPLASSAMS